MSSASAVNLQYLGVSNDLGDTHSIVSTTMTASPVSVPSEDKGRGVRKRSSVAGLAYGSGRTRRETGFTAFCEKASLHGFQYIGEISSSYIYLKIG